MDHVWLSWISPSWPRLLGMEVLEKGRQLPQAPQPFCIQPHRDPHARRHGICGGQGEAKQRGSGIERLGDKPPPPDIQSHLSFPGHPYG